MQIVRGEFGTTDNCGTTPSMDAVIELEFGDYTTVFRTSEEIQGEGFQMYTICFQPLERNLEGEALCVLINPRHAWVTILGS